MSHKSEERCESPPSPHLCSNNCGFFANPECNGMCSICFKDVLSQQTTPSKETEIPKAVTMDSPVETPEPAITPLEEADVATKRGRRLRCQTCHKRLGVMGFTCRCGLQFCQSHRYPEEHQCGFDRKAAERSKLKDENPVVLSDKIERV